jgi:predicted ArsR family transcriptional regulator
MPQEHDSEGNYGAQFTVTDVLEVFESIDEVAVITSDIADELGCSKQTARRRLNELHDAGRINKRTFGQQTVWWQLPPDTAEERPGRRLRRISQEIPESIVVGDIVYDNGETSMLTDEQAATVESAVEEVWSDG